MAGLCEAAAAVVEPGSVSQLRASAAIGCHGAPEPLPDWPDGEAYRLDMLNRLIANGYLRAALQCRSSWSDLAAPSVGCFCSHCNGCRWWCEREAPKCSRCRVCHAPLKPTQAAITEVRR